MVVLTGQNGPMSTGGLVDSAPFHGGFEPLYYSSAYVLTQGSS